MTGVGWIQRKNPDLLPKKVDKPALSFRDTVKTERAARRKEKKDVQSQL